MTPAQKKLVEQYMPFAERVACVFARANPDEYLDDVKADALYGLCLAGERFDVTRYDDRGPASFPAYAFGDVLGAIVAGVKFRKAGQHAAPVNDSGESVSLDELAAESRLTVEDLAEIRDEIAPVIDELRKIREASGSSDARARLTKQVARNLGVPATGIAYRAVNRAVELLDEIERDKASCN